MENVCLNCTDEPTTELAVGEFTTDLFCSWACLYEYIDVVND